MIRSATKRAAAAALCAALAASGLAACQAQEPSPEPSREEVPAQEPEAPEGAAAPADGVPTVPEEWLSGPGEFDSEKDRERYEAGEWHTDGELQNKYGFKEVRTEDGVTYAAGELVVSLPFGTSDDEIAALAESLGATVAKVSDLERFDERRITLVISDYADIEAIADEVSGMEGVKGASPNFSGSVDDGAEGDLAAGLVADPMKPSQSCLVQSIFESAGAEGGADKASAARDAMPALEMLGLASVEESGWGWRPEIG